MRFARTAHSNAHAFAHTECDGDEHRYADPYLHSERHANGNADPGSDGDIVTDSDVYRDADGHCNPDHGANAHCHAYRDGDSDIGY